MHAGALILAAGKPYYGERAWNCAVTLKANQADLPVALACTRSAISSLTVEQLALFDALVYDVEKDVADGDFMRAKTRMFWYSPWDATMYLDADTAWCPGRIPAKLFQEIGKYDFTAQCNTYFNIEKGVSGNVGYTYWGEARKIADYYSLKSGRLPQLNSSFLWWKKNTRTENLFAIAAREYDNPNAPLQIPFRSGKPDEFFFNVACASTGILPHRFHWHPLHLPYLHKKEVVPSMIQSRHWGMTLAGNVMKKVSYNIYNKWVEEAAERKGYSTFFPHIDKREVIPEAEHF